MSIRSLLLRDTHVLPIWEGTTNVLALDALLRGEASAGLAAVSARIAACATGLRDSRLEAALRHSTLAIEHVSAWLRRNDRPATRQAGARRLAMTIGRALQLALLAEHAHWQLNSDRDEDRDSACIACVARFAATPVDLLIDDVPN